ncbi:DarT ssDNA thymidine ADP-ribosyltransferase family protein [Pelagibacterium lacus]|uniref:DUF4433 domain-containing protein n=1 Tax=Pelagibacterium lacus TaxID=2282655 RepID=A0A369W2P5_9HYPH|nr:DarT ssDNA thymidine ADP-ribosyltransferase family protein [Pelagibacterium lacus]RDE07630.1 DUF4433 domain-containing protein [Pelagibacterium lacus]
MTIADIVAERGITEILHFTTNRGLVGSLATHAVLSRRALPKEAFLEHVLHPNAHQRPENSALFDKSADWLDYINLSITAINRRFFVVSERWHQDTSVWWGILSFDPVILSHPGVVFATTNNGYNQCVRVAGINGLKGLFAARIARKPDWTVNRTGMRADNLTTCEQAEVLYPTRVPMEFLRKIYVRTGDDRDRVRGFVREFGYDEVDVTLDPEKFLGSPN